MKYYGLIDIENLGYGFVEEGDSRITDSFIEITDNYHQQLLDEQSQGLEIVSDNKTVFTAEPNLYFVNSQGLWEKKTNEEYEEEKKRQEAERIGKLSLTKREVFLAIYKDKGITPEQIRAQITDPEALIEFDYAEKYYRGNPLIDVLGMALGYTKEQLDYLFEHKELPKPESELVNE